MFNYTDINKIMISITTSFVVLISAAPYTQVIAAPNTLELFGSPIKNANRHDFQQLLKENGMSAIREDPSYWVDIYDPNGLLKGASEFDVGYVAKTNEFAYAQYKFPGFVNTGLVKDVVDLVQSKYGKPSNKKGHYSVGQVTVTWNMAEGMKIEVSRGWPDTTTYLTFIDSKSRQAMQAEIDKESARQLEKKAKDQNKAF